MLVELGLGEQRYRAVLEVLNGVPVVEVARRYWVARHPCLHQPAGQPGNSTPRVPLGGRVTGIGSFR